MTVPLTDVVDDETPELDEIAGVDFDPSTAPEPDAATDSPDGDTPAPDPAGQPTAPATPDASGVPTPSSVPAPEPFALTAHGKTLTLDGAQRIPGEGLRIPEGPALQRAQQLMSRGVEMETYGRQRIRELELHTRELSESQSDAEAHAGAIISWFNEISADPQVMFDVLSNWAQSRPLIDVRIEQAKFANQKRAWERQQQAGQPSNEERIAQLVSEEKTVGVQVAKSLAAQHGVTEDQAEAIANRLMRRQGLYLVEAKGPDGKPTVVFDDRRFAQEFAEDAQEKAQQRSSVQAVQSAAQKNAATLAGTIPSTVKRTTAPATSTPKPRNSDGQFTSKEEWERSMGLR